MKETLNIIKNDPWLEPFADAITGRHQYALNKEAELTNKGKQTLSDFASGYLYFGLHRTPKGWTFREWAPNATHIYMVGTFNNWEEKAAYKLKKLKNGNWEINLPADAIQHGDLYKLNVYWDGGQGERIPAWATRVVQDEQTKIFSAQVWAPEKPYKFKNRSLRPPHHRRWQATGRYGLSEEVLVTRPVDPATQKIVRRRNPIRSGYFSPESSEILFFLIPSRQDNYETHS